MFFLVLRGKIKINNDCSWLCVVYVNVFTSSQMKIVPSKSQQILLFELCSPKSALAVLGHHLVFSLGVFLGGIKYPTQMCDPMLQSIEKDTNTLALFHVFMFILKSLERPTLTNMSLNMCG